MVELLVVVSIIAIMTGALIPSFSGYTRNQALRQAQEQLLNDLFTAQNNALAGRKNTLTPSGVTHWGLRFNQVGLAANEYEFVTSSNPTDCVGATSERRLSLTEDMDIVNSSNACVFFSISNGNSYGAANKNVRVQRAGSTSCYEISITDVGLITRKKDLTTVCP
jgi:Tfp pilus assembly protein FimT